VTTWRSTEAGACDSDPKPVAESLDRVTRAFGAPRARLLASLFSRWETIVGEEIAQHAEPRSLRDGVLVLVVDQPAWAAQLRYLAADLLARLQVDVGPSEVAEIQVRVAAQCGSAGGIRGSGRRRDGASAGSSESAGVRRSHPPLVEWKHPGSGR
jgi:predicted nucleic acid-binding Zn ribbon protein